MLIIIILFSVTGCGKEKSELSSNKKYSLGESAETDVLKFKLIAGEFTYALVNTTGDEFAMPKEYDAKVDNDNPYVAAKGHTLASFTFYIENLDRSSIDIGGSFNPIFGSITYENKNYGNNNEANVKFKSVSNDNLNWESYPSDNILLFAGDKKYFRAYIDIPTDVKSLDDTMELTIYLPSSNNKVTAFKYVISEEDRNSYKGEEIPEDIAIKNLDRKVVQEYFKNRLNDYSAITGDAIKQSIEGKKFNVTEIGGAGIWEGTFTFETSGKIYEGGNKYAVGYVNGRTFAIDGDYLILSWVNGRKETISNKCEIRKIKDETYLLIENGEIHAILYK